MIMGSASSLTPRKGGTDFDQDVEESRRRPPLPPQLRERLGNLRRPSDLVPVENYQMNLPDVSETEYDESLSDTEDDDLTMVTRPESLYNDQIGRIWASLFVRTSGWNAHILESLGIFYNDSYHSSPMDILNIIFDELNVFGPWTEDKKIDYVKQFYNIERLQHCINFSSTIHDIIGDNEDVIQDQDGGIFHPEIEEDLENLSGDCDLNHSNVEDFLVSTQLMISYQAAYLNGLRDDPVPGDMFVDIFKSFSKMCDILPVPGTAMKCSMSIHNVNVQSISDIILIPKEYRRCPFAKETSCIVSFSQIGKNRPLKQDDTTLQNPGNHKVRRNRDDLDDSEFSDAEHSQRRVGEIYRVEDSVDYSESDGLTLPPLFDIVSEGTLAKHGGDLLIHRDIYGGILSKGRIWKYLPGMICMGTEIIFTLLKIKGNHLKELSNIAKNHNAAAKLESEATIFYSEPKDLLKKEDRDMLIEAFLRLSSIHNMNR